MISTEARLLVGLNESRLEMKALLLWTDDARSFRLVVPAILLTSLIGFVIERLRSGVRRLIPN